MEICFRGVRGSYPVAGPDTVRYGGNTSCVEVRLDNGALIILDAGSGLRTLGDALMVAEFGRGAGEAAIFLSHVHLDHIMGLPFFAPATVAGNRFTIHALRRKDGPPLADLVAKQQSPDYFDRPFSDYPASFSFVEADPGDAFSVGGARVSCALLNHPGGALAWRIDGDGGALAYVTDTAPLDGILIGDGFIRHPKDAMPEQGSAGWRELERRRERLHALLAGADLVVYDTFFEPTGFASRPHWGHSTPDHAIASCRAAGARRLALFHHAPDNTDAKMDEIAAKYRAEVAGTELDVFVAAEGTCVRVPVTGKEAPRWS